MPTFKWELSEKDTVSLVVGWTGRKKLLLNNHLVERFAKRKSKPFKLSDGRSAEVATAHGIAHQAVELRVDGELAFMSLPGQQRKCPKCEAVARPYDKFCESCGASLPSADKQQAVLSVSTASNGIGVLAILFLISGCIYAGLQYSQAQDALEQIAQYDASAQWSVPVNGQTVNVGQLREMIEWEPKATLLVNLILAAIMTGLYFWGKRSPLPAILVATGTYLAVVVLSAIVSPETLAQGIFLKFIVIAMLYRGIKAGFQQRALQA